jgi:hypothetical protein
VERVIEDYNVACGSVWVRNLVSDISEGTWTERMFENRVLRRILRPKRDEVTGVWKELHNEELLNLYSSSSIIRMIKTTRMRLARNGAEEERV